MGSHIGLAVPAVSGAPESEVLRRTLAEALATLAEVLVASEAPPDPEILPALEQCRAQLTAGARADILDPLARSCFAAMRKVAAQARSRVAEQRSQVTTVIAMIRETVATVAGEHASFQDTVTESTARFERIAGMDDLQQIQQHLLQEVASLRRLTIERRAAWDQTVSEFGTRLSTLEAQLDHSRREAALDPLTNVANRRSYERTCREWLGPNRPGFVMAMIDVDDFKLINDRHGHAVGDRVLVTVADTLVHSLRAGDVVARLGGDEFAVLATNLTLAQSQGRLAMIGRAVQNACRALVPDGAGPSISIGVAECSAGDTLESLQQRADEALYEAKRNGKGRLAVRATAFIRDLRKER